MKTGLQIVLWIVIGFLGYLVYDAVITPIQFNKIKKERYLPVIKKLKDVRTAELAFKEVNGRYSGDFDDLVTFIDTAQFVITQRRDTSYLDKEFKRVYGVDKYVQDIIIDTLGHVSVKDSLFKTTDSYKTMMYVPNTNQQVKFELEADSIYRNEDYLPVFQARVDKSIVLEGLDEHLIAKEKKANSVDEINGAYIQVGSMNKVNTNGNWPKNYGKIHSK